MALGQIRSQQRFEKADTRCHENFKKKKSKRNRGKGSPKKGQGGRGRVTEKWEILLPRALRRGAEIQYKIRPDTAKWTPRGPVSVPEACSRTCLAAAMLRIFGVNILL
jgi:hypothetical protein